MEVKTSEFFKNIKTLPPPGSPEFKQLIDWEIEKCLGGVTVQGVFIPGWLYWHINHWYIALDDEDEFGNVVSPPGLADLRDNEWQRAEHLENCRREKKGYIEVGGRQLGKSVQEASFSTYNSILFQNSQNIIIGNNSNDLDMLKQKIDFGLKHLWEGINIPRLDKTWRGNQVRLGYKEINGDDVLWSTILIRNTDGGKNTEVAAGTTAKSFVMDEIGKSDFSKSYEAAKPAFRSKFGFRAIPMLVGCLTAGNKVFNKEGNLINIENLQKEEGIIGFDKDKQSISVEDILHINPPQEKECFKLLTNKGTELECSFDHPILIKHRNKKVRGVRILEFLETKDLEEGMLLSLPDKIPLLGKKEMKDPYFIGAIIGDGNYSSDRGIRFYNEDDEIWNYIDSIGKDYTVFNSHTTEKGRLYREARFRGGMSQLEELGIYGQSKEKKDLPVDIHLYRESDIVELLAGLFDTDGCILVGKNNTNNIISLSSGSEILVNSVKLLLIRLGIHSNKSYVKPDKRDRKIRSIKGHYVLDISDRESILKFCDIIPLKIKRKVENLNILKKIFENRKSKIDRNYKNLRFERIVRIEKTGKKPVYNLTTSTTHTYLANGIVTHNTGGAFERGDDAERMFYNPEANDFLSVLDAETGKRTGLFMSGIYRQDCKYKTTLADFLIKEKGLQLEGISELEKIEIWVSDKEKAKKTILEEREIKKKDPDQTEYLKLIMYNPLTPEECFMRNANSIFNIKAAKAQQQKLQVNNITGSTLFLTSEGESIVPEFTDKKPISKFPHTPACDLDAPIVVWETPIFNPPWGLYVAGVDPYRHDKSAQSKSLGSVYIFKRIHDIQSEKSQYKFVASYVARPEDREKWNEQARLLIKWYNARTLCENDEMSFITYMKYKGDASRYLEPQPAWLQEIMPNTQVTREYGMHSHGKTIEYRDGCLKKYLEEVIHQEINEEGSIISEVQGVSQVLDPMLLEEVIKHDSSDKNWNGDRIVAAGLALALSYHLDPIIKASDDTDQRAKAYLSKNPRSTLFGTSSTSSSNKIKNRINKLFK